MGLSELSIYAVRWLYAGGKVGNKYTNIRYLRCALPTRFRNKTIIKGLIKELRKEGLIVPHKKGTCISLNPHKLKDIEKKYILPPKIE